MVNMHGKKITAATIAEARGAFAEDVRKLGTDVVDVYKKPKMQKVPFRGVEVECAAVSVLDECLAAGADQHPLGE